MTRNFGKNLIIIERYGRIAGLWNRAKLVTTYSGLLEGCSPEPYTGRLAITDLVKIEEHIEIMEPHRDFPERETDVVGCVFHRTRFEVDSTSGKRVEMSTGAGIREGWILSPSQKGIPETPYDMSLEFILKMTSADNEHIRANMDFTHFPFFIETTAGASPDPSKWEPFEGVDTMVNVITKLPV